MFIVVLFIEMYGFLLIIYFLLGWFVEIYLEVNFFVYENGYLLYIFFGFKGDVYWDLFYIVSMVFIVVGFFILFLVWNVLYYV